VTVVWIAGFVVGFAPLCCAVGGWLRPLWGTSLLSVLAGAARFAAAALIPFVGIVVYSAAWFAASGCVFVGRLGREARSPA